MTRFKQATLKNEIRATGIGVHSGKKVYVTLRPAPVNTGIVFRRVDLNPVVEIPARAEFIGDTNLATSLIKDGVRIATVEHLLSALFGLGITNLYIDLNSPEVPMMDGSASPFVFLIQSAGIEEQSETRKFLRIKQEVAVNDGDRWVRLEPHDGFKVSFTIDFKHPLLNKNNQQASFDLSHSSYTKEISRARTFGFIADYEYLKQKNLAIGASLDNALVLDESGIMNQDGFRYPNELARHKILDAIGDLYLLGDALLGSFTGHKSGHSLNCRLIRELLATENAWEIVGLKNDEIANALFPTELPIKKTQEDRL